MYNNSPMVSVLMAVYNGEKFVAQSIDSILQQTFTNFELIVINDASWDDTPNILQHYQDSRLKIYTNEQNMGLTKTLNRGLGLVQGKYIARMDADDISVASRLEKQVDFMEKNHSIGVLGGWIRNFDQGKSHIWQLATTHEQISCKLLFTTQLVHGTALLRKSVLDKHQIRYNEDFLTSQDYELWTRLIEYTQFANLPEVLVEVRHHGQQVTKINANDLLTNTAKIRLAQIHKLGIEPTKNEELLHYYCTHTGFVNNLDHLQNLSTWLLKLYQQNQTKQVYPTVALGELLAQIWDKHTAGQTPLGMRFFQLIKQNPLSAYHQWSSMQRFRFWLKCVLKR